MSDRVPGHAAVGPADADFRVCVATVEQMLGIQHESERFAWATRWSSSQKMLQEVANKRIYICPLIRERRNAEGVTTKYRCLVLYHRAGRPGSGAVVTFDIAAETLMALPSLELSPDVKRAFADVFVLATNGIEMSIKD
jgi:hypothetical protein